MFCTQGRLAATLTSLPLVRTFVRACMPQQLSSIEGRYMVTSVRQQMGFARQRCTDFREPYQAWSGFHLWPEACQPELNGVGGIGSRVAETQVRISALTSTGFMTLVSLLTRLSFHVHMCKMRRILVPTSRG